MQKRTFLSIVFTVLLAIVTLFGTGSAVAQEDECSEPILSCTTASGWSVELMDGGPVPVEGGYRWRYKIEALEPESAPALTLQSVETDCDCGGDDCDECDGCKCPPPPPPPMGLKNVNLSIPVCCPDPVIIGDSAPRVRIKDPGIPGGAGFGKGILQSYVLRWNFNDYPQEAEVWFITNSNNIAKGTVGLVIEGVKTLEPCEINVPGCPEFALKAIVEESFVSTTDGRRFRQILNPYTQCPEEIYEIIPCDNFEACYGEPQICEPCRGDFYERQLQKKSSSEVLQASHGNDNPELGPEPVIFLGNPGDDCGGAIVKSDSDNSWFFCFLGWCFF